MAAIIVGLPFLLIAQQPDLGTAVTLLPICLGIAVFAGLRLRHVAVLVVLAILTAPVAWTYGLEDYQRQRISIFLDPGQDASGAGYQQLQAQITVGSGGPMGKGFLQGTQSQYNFLPVCTTTSSSRCWRKSKGSWGGGRPWVVSVRHHAGGRCRPAGQGSSRDLPRVGVMSGFAFQVIYNIAMSAGLAPVKGLTLPLMSYGGSSVIATLAAFGLVLNVRIRRFTN